MTTASAITLHHCMSARSFRVLWMLEELGLPYTLKMWPFPPRQQGPLFLEHNPLGTVPAFIDGEVRMSESSAICQYLAARCAPHPMNVQADEPAFGAYLNFLHFGEATLTFPQTLVLRYRQFEPGKAEVVADDYAKWFLSRLRHVDRALAEAEWLCADRFTAADISVGYALLLANSLKLSETFSPAVAAYWERLKARPAFQSAKAAQKMDLAQALSS